MEVPQCVGDTRAHRRAQTGHSDVAVMRAADGLQRRTVAANAGWPAFGPGGLLYYHRRAPDGW